MRTPLPPAPAPLKETARWLTPTNPLVTTLGYALYAVNKALMRGLFGLHVTGREALPATGGFVIAPNHASFLDPMAVAAALSWRQLRRLYWAGDALLLFGNPAARLVSRAMHVFPVEAAHPAAALDTAAQALAAGNGVVWFPEGWRSPDGMLQRFLPGIGELLLRSRAPAVLACISGAFEAWPRNRCLPRLHRITVTFDHPEPVAALRLAGAGRSDEERIADALHQRAAGLAAEAAARSEAARALPQKTPS
jgi:long-chain acyl-CoA synthetase